MKLKKLTYAVIEGFFTLEQEAKSFVIQAKSTNRRFVRTVTIDAVQGSDGRRVPSEPVIIEIPQKDNIAFSAKVILSDGSTSESVLMSADNTPSIQSPYEFDLITGKTSLSIYPLYDPVTTDILRHEWIVRQDNNDPVFTPTDESVPTHISNGTNRLVIPTEPNQQWCFWARRIDTKGNVGDWIALGGNPISSNSFTKTDAGLGNLNNDLFDSSGNFKGNVISSTGEELINSANRTINSNVQNYKKVIYSPSNQVSNSDDIGSIVTPSKTFYLTNNSQDAWVNKLSFNYVKQSGDSKVKLFYRATEGNDIETPYSDASDFDFRLQINRVYGVSNQIYYSSEGDASEVTLEYDISNTTNFPVGCLLLISLQAKRIETSGVLSCDVYVGEAYVV